MKAMNWLLTEIRALGVEVDLGQPWQPRSEDVSDGAVPAS